jgi:hypothetical protein
LHFFTGPNQKHELLLPKLINVSGTKGHLRISYYCYGIKIMIIRTQKSSLPQNETLLRMWNG